MKTYITIDGGTTNTRVNLVQDKKLIKSEKISMGAKDCIGGNGELKKRIEEKIIFLLSFGKIEKSDITAVIASGMITSEYGLCELKHLDAPAGMKELHDGIKKVFFPEICGLEINFIPGVKVGADSPETADMMRGEETELYGLYDGSDGVYVLPGSHSKLIATDKNGRISDFKTMLTGEMIAALSGNTILKDAVDLSVSEYDREYLIMGYNYCMAQGINNALFKTRILKNLFKKNTVQTYSYFMGVVLTAEIEALKKYGKDNIIIGGKSQIKYAMSDIIKAVCSLNVTCVSDEAVDSAVALGAVKVFEYGE
ncbi:MAG: hypothetical protein E7588_03540 [Ruminococcaceae bacterium]|nr:hypothetical protein [Oscillospiraceae bacterium]